MKLRSEEVGKVRPCVPVCKILNPAALEAMNRAATRRSGQVDADYRCVGGASHAKALLQAAETHATVEQQAAHVALSIASNEQLFSNGNQRTAMLAAEKVLRAHDFVLRGRIGKARSRALKEQLCSARAEFEKGNETAKTRAIDLLAGYLKRHCYHAPHGPSSVFEGVG